MATRMMRFFCRALDSMAFRRCSTQSKMNEVDDSSTAPRHRNSMLSCIVASKSKSVRKGRAPISEGFAKDMYQSNAIDTTLADLYGDSNE